LSNALAYARNFAQRGPGGGISNSPSTANISGGTFEDGPISITVYVTNSCGISLPFTVNTTLNPIANCMPRISTNLGNEYSDEAATVFPNPAVNDINISIHKSYEHLKIKLCNIFGAEIFAEEFSDVKINDIIALQTTSFSEDIYFLSLESISDISTFKVMVSK